MQPFSPGPCRFGLDSIEALKMSENMPFMCDVQVPISLCSAHDSTLPFCALYHFANVVLLLIIAKKSLERNRNGWR
jgi:hypothetical protein